MARSITKCFTIHTLLVVLIWATACNSEELSALSADSSTDKSSFETDASEISADSGNDAASDSKKSSSSERSSPSSESSDQKNVQSSQIAKTTNDNSENVNNDSPKELSPEPSGNQASSKGVSTVNDNSVKTLKGNGTSQPKIITDSEGSLLSKTVNTTINDTHQAPGNLSKPNIEPSNINSNESSNPLQHSGNLESQKNNGGNSTDIPSINSTDSKILGNNTEPSSGDKNLPDDEEQVNLDPKKETESGYPGNWKNPQNNENQGTETSPNSEDFETPNTDDNAPSSRSNSGYPGNWQNPTNKAKGEAGSNQNNANPNLPNNADSSPNTANYPGSWQPTTNNGNGGPWIDGSLTNSNNPSNTGNGNPSNWKTLNNGGNGRTWSESSSDNNNNLIDVYNDEGEADEESWPAFIDDGSTNASCSRSFPEGFMFGVATSAYQIEGAWNVTDKGVSIWDMFVRRNSSLIADGSTGDDACKSYQYSKRDIKMLKYLGVDFYKFSIAWTRILPKGTANYKSRYGLAYYNRLIDRLIEANIQPHVVMYKWDLPQVLQDMGGWRNESSPKWFEEYANVLFDNFGDRVKNWTTMVGMNNIAVNGYGTGTLAPGVKNHGFAEYEVAKNLVRAHARVWHLYNDKYRENQKGVVGVQIMTNFAQAARNTKEDGEAAEDAFEFEVGMYAHPIFSKEGGLPARIIEIVREKSRIQGFNTTRLKQFTKKEIEYIKGTSDFYGFDYLYAKNWTRKGYKLNETFDVPSVSDDIGAVVYDIDREVDDDQQPLGIRKILSWVKKRYNDPPILITYNSNSDTNDPEEKIVYFNKYMNAILDAIEKDSINIVGYVAWSLMDGFEWNKGYQEKNGLFEVNFDSYKRTRTPRKTAIWYKTLIKSRQISQCNESKTDDTF